MSFDEGLSSWDLPPLKTFDAFPKVANTYRTRSTKGGLATLGLVTCICLLVWHEVQLYFYGEPHFSFTVNEGVGHYLQVNVDLTVAMPCHCKPTTQYLPDLTVDVRDAVGDRLHISDEFTKDGTSFEIGQAQRLRTLEHISKQKHLSASRALSEARGKARFSKTEHLVPDGPACRIYGAMVVKKVTGNLHITTLGHGYLSWEHTDHELMNLSHVIHEFSFGPFFPKIVQPLDNSVEVANNHFHIFQYFISVVSTTYINAKGRLLDTAQYSVTDMSRETEHGRGVPGIFFKYDIEPMKLTIRERTSGIVQFIVRLAGIVGGMVVCSGYAWRVGHFGARLLKRTIDDQAPVSLTKGGRTVIFSSEKVI